MFESLVLNRYFPNDSPGSVLAGAVPSEPVEILKSMTRPNRGMTARSATTYVRMAPAGMPAGAVLALDQGQAPRGACHVRLPLDMAGGMRRDGVRIGPGAHWGDAYGGC